MLSRAFPIGAKAGGGMTGRGDFEQDYWRVAPSLSGDRPALVPSAIADDEFRLLADNIPTLCWIANGDGYIVWYNRRWYEYTGTSPEEMEGWGWQSVHDPERLPEVMDRWTNSIATGEPFEMTFPLRGADGVFRPFLTRVQPVRVANEKVVRWFGVNSDVSGQVASEERFRQVFENAAVGMIEIDATWNILKSNEAYHDITGRAEEDLRGASCLSFTHPDDVSAGEDALRALAAGAAGRVAFEKRYLRPGGDIVWVRSSLSRVSEDESPYRFLKVVEDITEIRRAREALRQESEALEVLNQTAAQVAAELDLPNVVQLVTDAGVKLTGARFGAFFYNTINEAGESLMLYTLSGANRSDFERFGHPRATPVFSPTFKGEGVIRSDDITADHRYGKNAPNKGMPEGHLPVRSYLAVPVVSRSGEVIGGLFFGHPEAGVFTESCERLMLGLAGQAAIAIDNARLFEAAQRVNQTLEQRVEERTRDLEAAHEALRQSQKMETVGQLTGGIAHDFNNLLQIVSGNLDLLRQKLPAGSEHLRRYADRAFIGADRAATLTQRLLAFSRRQPLAPKPLDINRLIPGMSELLHRTLGETIEVEAVLAPRLWTVEADPNQLENAIINLAINARDAMPEGGKLTIETQNTHLDHSYVAQNPEVAVGQYAVICISDTGVGMDAETAAKAVEPFFTTKEVGRGTGLGLSMVYGFVKQSGGHIKIYSEPGEGTTVKMYLPRLLGTFDRRPMSPTMERPKLRAKSQFLFAKMTKTCGPIRRRFCASWGTRSSKPKMGPRP